MKRNTLILLLIAVVALVAVYFIEVRPGKPRDEEPEKSRPAFKFSREDVTGISVVRGGQTVNLENQNNKWVITQPVSAAADSGDEPARVKPHPPGRTLEVLLRPQEQLLLAR